jgi:hypothetical protein
MKLVARWAWVAVLGTALALSWWSLDALARHYGMPALLAGMVSATFDGSALVAADLAMKLTREADSAALVKLLMFSAVGLSAWLNFEHGALLHYPFAVRVLFATPPILGGSLFELHLRGAHRARLRELGRIATPLPPLGTAVWVMHPFASMRRMSQITASRLRSIPLDVMDYAGVVPSTSAPKSAPGNTVVPALVAQIVGAQPNASARGTCAPSPRPVRRKTVSDEHYVAQVREIVMATGVVPSAREVARLLHVGQDRARRLVVMVTTEQDTAATIDDSPPATARAS